MTPHRNVIFVLLYRTTKPYLNLIMLVLIGKLSLSTLGREEMCKGFSHFSCLCIILYWPN